MEPKAPATGEGAPNPDQPAGTPPQRPSSPPDTATSSMVAPTAGPAKREREVKRGNNQFPIPPWPSQDEHPRHKRDEYGRLIFDLGVIKGLGQIGASYREIATVIGCDPKTLGLRIRAPGDPVALAYEEGRSEMCATLRRKQIAVAMQGNVRMLTWLGMQLLDQKNVAKQTVESRAKVEQSFTFTIKQGAEEGDDGEARRVVEMEAEPASEDERPEPKRVNAHTNGNGNGNGHHPEAIIITAPPK